MCMNFFSKARKLQQSDRIVMKVDEQQKNRKMNFNHKASALFRKPFLDNPNKYVYY